MMPHYVSMMCLRCLYYVSVSFFIMFLLCFYDASMMLLWCVYYASIMYLLWFYDVSMMFSMMSLWCFYYVAIMPLLWTCYVYCSFPSCCYGVSMMFILFSIVFLFCLHDVSIMLISCFYSVSMTFSLFLLCVYSAPIMILVFW